jgi:hypothetical protein
MLSDFQFAKQLSYPRLRIKAMEKPEVVLPLEKQFELLKVKGEIDKLNLEQAREYAYELAKTNLAQQAIYQELLKKNWGIF